MNADERAAAAASLKARGNAAYQQRSFERAAELYTRAIAASPLPEPVFYSNRAACMFSPSYPAIHTLSDTVPQAT
jgi:import receptor subunit TOM70